MGRLSLRLRDDFRTTQLRPVFAPLRVVPRIRQRLVKDSCARVEQVRLPAAPAPAGGR